MVIPSNLRSLYPYKGAHLQVDGGQLHYLDEGEAKKGVIVAVHGNPTWSFYWRALIEEFSSEYRVVIPDHIGCGLSDKPQNWPYRLEGHINNLVALIEHLDLHNITLVVHDWGGAIGMGMAGRLTERITRLVVTNTAAFRSQEIPLSIASCRIPLFGTLAVRGGNAFAWVATIRATAKGLSSEVKQGLLLPYNNWANRIATLRFVEDIPLKESHPSYATLVQVEEGLERLKNLPMLICWGDDDFCFTPNFRKEWEQRFPDAEVHAWPDIGHYVMEDARDRVLPLMHRFLGHSDSQD